MCIHTRACMCIHSCLYVPVLCTCILCVCVYASWTTCYDLYASQTIDNTADAHTVAVLWIESCGTRTRKHTSTQAHTHTSNLHICAVNRPKTQPAQKKKPRVKDPKDIWDIDEVSDDELNNDDDDFDDRTQPEFEIMYKQSVSAEDKYMNMGMKDCSSNFCDGIVIKIEFPNTAYSEISLDVTKTRLVAQSIK